MLRVSCLRLQFDLLPLLPGPWVFARLPRRSSPLVNTVSVASLPAQALACWANAAFGVHQLHPVQGQGWMRVPVDMGVPRPLLPVQEVLRRPPSPGGSSAPLRGLGLGPGVCRPGSSRRTCGQMPKRATAGPLPLTRLPSSPRRLRASGWEASRTSWARRRRGLRLPRRQNSSDGRCPNNADGSSSNWPRSRNPWTRPSRTSRTPRSRSPGS